MIHGTFDEGGRPSIDCFVAFPPVKRPEATGHLLNATFVIDTGADTSVMLPEHLRPYSYSDFVDDYPLDYPDGFGGSMTVRRVPVRFYFPEDDGDSFIYLDQEVEVARPSRNLLGLPSVVGRDVLDNFRITIDKNRYEVTLEESPVPPDR